MIKIFVTGASGYVGGRLVQTLIEKKFHVVAFARSKEAAEKIRKLAPLEVLTVVVGNFAQPQTYQQALSGCDAVIHVAAHFKFFGPVREFTQGNQETTKTLLNTARQSGVRRFIYVSAGAVIQGKPEAIVQADESYPYQHMAWAPYSTSKALTEEWVLAQNQVGGPMETMAIRPPMIWGKNMPTLDHMVEVVRSGQFRWADGGNQKMGLAHVDNVCHAAILAISNGQPGKAYFITDDEEHRFKDVITAMLATRNIPAPTAVAPFAVAWVMAMVMEWVWRMLGLKGEPPITRQVLRLIGKDFTLNITRAKQELGYHPVIQWQEGIKLMQS